jgi:alanine racemase
VAGNGGAVVNGQNLVRWAEVDLDAIRHNVTRLKGRLTGHTRLLAVVKADAYGHGARGVAAAVLAGGADWLGVATVEEGLELREVGVKVPILVMGPPAENLARDALREELRLCVYDEAVIHHLQDAAAIVGVEALLHLKVDTGMSRLGAAPGEAKRLAQLIAGSQLSRLDGIWTHFAEADDRGHKRSAMQLRLFRELVDNLQRSGLEPALVHAANSAATLTFPEAHLDMVRCGLPVYGYASVAEPPPELDLRPALSWKARVVALHQLRPGEQVGYGGTFTAAEDCRIATISVGYADGYRRALSSRGKVLVGGRRAPVVGRVSMDFITADVTAVGHVALGDEVVLIGRQDDERIGADEMAAMLDTITWEVLTGIGSRVVRVHQPEAGRA